MNAERFKLIDDAVAARVRVLIVNWRQRPGDYLYYGRRTAPDDLGWRFRQTYYTKISDDQGRRGLQAIPPAAMADEIAAGKHDVLLELVWHDAASASWYYRYEKDYGEPEGPRENTSEEDGDE